MTIFRTEYTASENMYAYTDTCRQIYKLVIKILCVTSLLLHLFNVFVFVCGTGTGTGLTFAGAGREREQRLRERDGSGNDSRGSGRERE